MGAATAAGERACTDDVDGEDDDHSRHYLRAVLVAAAHHNSSRRLASEHLEVSFNH